ncbi:MAG: ABC transporter permease subunit [Clostridia bacterium]|nr:ABC transporter permease subunit [Clostridia bacterium]
MDKLQQFWDNFCKMTFEGKAAFWVILAAILVVILVYIFAERIKGILKGKTKLLLLIPVAILVGAVLFFINACQYVPLTERSAENPVTASNPEGNNLADYNPEAYTWETTRDRKENLRYKADVKDVNGNAYDQKFNFEEIYEQFSVEQKSEHVIEDFTITSSDGAATIVFDPDGNYVLSAPGSGVEETGQYSYSEETKTLLVTSASGETFSAKTPTGQLKYTGDGFSFAFKASEIKKIKDECVATATTEYVSQEYVASSYDGYYTDEVTTLTFYPDGTYRFLAQESQAEETGKYIFRDGWLTLANVSESGAFWKNAGQGPLRWFIIAVVFAVVLTLVFGFSTKIKAFLKRHPKIWLLIPAALLVYFVYVAIGWNVWTSVSDWQDGSQTASFNWNSDAWKSKASIENIKLAERENEDKNVLILLYKAEDLAIDTYEFKINYTLIQQETEAEEAEQGTESAETLKKEVPRTDYFFIPVSSFEAAAGSGADRVYYSDNVRAKIAFAKDGSFTFETVSGEYEEEGTYTCENGSLILTRTTPEAEPVNAQIGQASYSTTFEVKSDTFSCPINSDEGKVLEETTFTSEDNAKITFNTDQSYTFEVPEHSYTETGVYTYQVCKDNYELFKYLTVANATGGEAAGKSFASGFTQYSKMFTGMTGEEFWNAVKNTLLLFLIIPICLLLGLALAMVMDQGLKGTPAFRTLILLPFALSFVVTGLIWQQMFNGNSGIIAEFFKLFGVNLGINWTSNELVMVSIMLVMVWQFSGYVAVIFLAAIKNVPTNIINAAKLDGSYMPRIYWKMILPQMKGAMGSCITILAMYALRSFDLIVSLVGYTNNAATTLPIMMYNEAFQKNNFAYAAAISCFLLALVLVLILPLTYAMNRRKK